MPIRSLHFFATGCSLGLTIWLTNPAQATDPPSPRPERVTLTSLITGEVAETGGEIGVMSASDLPASTTALNKVVPLATGGSFVFEPLPTRGMCSLRPDVRCVGPDYRGCTPRIYYGTNPCDDDPVLTMSPTVCDPITSHWYDKALNLVLRKKKIAEVINP